MNFATIDATAYRFFAEALSLEPGRFPALVIEDVMSGDTVPFDQNKEITGDAVGKFIENYFSRSGTSNWGVKVRRPYFLVLFGNLILSLGGESR